MSQKIKIKINQISGYNSNEYYRNFINSCKSEATSVIIARLFECKCKEFKPYRVCKESTEYDDLDNNVR